MRKPTLKKPSFDLSNLKLPKLSRGSGGSSSRSKPDIPVPRFASDLYADLRDRRLLPLVALLLVAIAATPFLLAGKGDGEEETVPPSSSQISPGEAAEASFSVVPAAPALRDYQERLGHRKARNPFAQPSVGPTAAGAGSAAGGEEIAVEGGAGGGAEASTPSELPGLESGGSPSAEPGTSTTTTTTTDVTVESKISSYALKARLGFLGDLEEHEGVTPMTTLPSEKNAVLVFIGPSKDKNGAVFLMTSDVTAFYGKAKCVLDELTCTTVELRPGESATFAVGYGKTRLKLILQKLYPVVEDREAASTVTEKETKKDGTGAADPAPRGGLRFSK